MDVRIDALRLRAAGIGEEPAQRLASLIAAAPQRRAGVLPQRRAGRLGRLDVTLRAGTGDSLDDLADGAAAEVLRAVSGRITATGPAR